MASAAYKKTGASRGFKICSVLLACAVSMMFADIFLMSTTQFKFDPMKYTQIHHFSQTNLTHTSTVRTLKHHSVDHLKLPAFQRVGNTSLFLYSAIWKSGNNQTAFAMKVNRTIVITSWVHRLQTNLSQACCFLLKNQQVETGLTFQRRDWRYLRSSSLQAKKFICSTNINPNQISGVSLAIGNRTCPSNSSEYISPDILSNANTTANEIAVCAKLAYGSLSADRLIEWMEAMRLLGVDRVLAYIYNLNAMALKVFRFYEKMGFAELRPFGLPDPKLRRTVGSKNMHAWNDEQITVFDCVERLQNYKFVALVDTDEFVIPVSKNFSNSLKTFLENTLVRIPNMAGINLLVKVHVTSWTPTNKNHPLFIGRYTNATAAILDRAKGIFMPQRVDGVHTHGFWAVKGYRKLNPKTTEINIHHFRGCRGEWLRKNNNITMESDYIYQRQNETKCYDFKQYREPVIEKLAEAIKTNVSDTKSAIGVVNSTV